MIPIVRPTLFDYEAVVEEFRQAWESGQVTTGQFTRRLEALVEDRLQVNHAIMVQSCTAGLMLVLKALKLTGEVILPAFTWTATAHAAVWNSLTPVFADITPGTYTLDPQAVTRAIGPRTAAIMPVNVFGCPPDYEALGLVARERGVRLIYDSAQGLGSRFQPADEAWRYAGVFGDAEVFSLSPTKVISAMEGGLITTHHRALADQLRQMRDYGKSPDSEDIAWLGLSARVPEINAIVGRHSFEKLDFLVARRHELITAYRAAFQGLPGVTFQQIPPNRLSSGNYFTLFITADARASRDEAYRRLNRGGIQTKKYFYPALHLQAVYRSLRETYQGRLPLTEAASAQGLALPLFSHMTPETFQEIVDGVLEVLG